MTALVTKASLYAMLVDADDRKKAQIIGRALVAIFNRQTAAEQSCDHTQEDNGVGFAGCDAKTGSLSAKSFIKHGSLQGWVVDKWMAPSRGYPRICKYAKQLNEIAQEKQLRIHNNRLAALRQEYGMAVDSDDPAIITPIVAELRQLELQLNVAPYVISGAIA